MPAVTCFERCQYAVLAIAVSAALQASAADAAIGVPDNLHVAATQTLALEAHADGAQIYTCSADPAKEGKPGWLLKAPDAVLYDAGGARLATHYAGPTRESLDGSKVIGKARASATPTVGAIPWLLLDVKSTA